MATTYSSIRTSLSQVLGITRTTQRVLVCDQVILTDVPVRIQLRDIVIRVQTEGVLLVLTLTLICKLNHLLSATHANIILHLILQLRCILTVLLSHHPIKVFDRDQVGVVGHVLGDDAVGFFGRLQSVLIRHVIVLDIEGVTVSVLELCHHVLCYAVTFFKFLKLHTITELKVHLVDIRLVHYLALSIAHIHCHGSVRWIQTALLPLNPLALRVIWVFLLHRVLVLFIVESFNCRLITHVVAVLYALKLIS